MCDIAWFEDFLALNPQEARRRDTIVAYAESQSGAVREFIQLLFPRYWGLVEDPDKQSGITAGEEKAILCDLAQYLALVVPELVDRADPSLRFPGSVRHIH